jgi:hypothetical protein
MRCHFIPIVATAMIVPSMLSARFTLDVRPVCRGIASQSADPLGAGLRATFEQCVNGKQEVCEQIKREWPTRG